MGRSQNRKMEFQLFTVSDEKCAMKIGTDGVLLGAWASTHSAEKALNIADVGSGSGVVALMLAQRFTESQVTAVELEPLAVEQSRENFEHSPFDSRMKCVEASFQDWASESDNQSSFDLVVSNPPFFNGKPKSPFHARNLAGLACGTRSRFNGSCQNSQVSCDSKMYHSTHASAQASEVFSRIFKSHKW